MQTIHTWELLSNFFSPSDKYQDNISYCYQTHLALESVFYLLITFRHVLRLCSFLKTSQFVSNILSNLSLNFYP